jgi:hypothetical protein
MIDVLTPFGLSVVYLTTDAMPSVSEGLRERLRLCAHATA